MSVSERSLTAPPRSGIYRDGAQRYEVRIYKRGHWYGLRQEPDGSLTYLAQNVDLASLTAVSERQPSEHCSEAGCSLPQWYRGLCGTHLAADAVRYAQRIGRGRFPSPPLSSACALAGRI